MIKKIIYLKTFIYRVTLLLNKGIEEKAVNIDGGVITLFTCNVNGS